MSKSTLNRTTPLVVMGYDVAREARRVVKAHPTMEACDVYDTVCESLGEREITLEECCDIEAEVLDAIERFGR